MGSWHCLYTQTVPKWQGLTQTFFQKTFLCHVNHSLISLDHPRYCVLVSLRSAVKHTLSILGTEKLLSGICSVKRPFSMLCKSVRSLPDLCPLEYNSWIMFLDTSVWSRIKNIIIFKVVSAFTSATPTPCFMTAIVNYNQLQEVKRPWSWQVKRHLGSSPK